MINSETSSNTPTESLCALIDSSFKCMDSIMSSYKSSNNSFYRLLFNMLVNDCLVHLVVLDMCVDNVSKLSLKYVNENQCRKYCSMLSENASRTPSLTFAILTTLIAKLKNSSLSNYHGIYSRLFNYIVANMKI